MATLPSGFYKEQSWPVHEQLPTPCQGSLATQARHSLRGAPIGAERQGANKKAWRHVRSQNSDLSFAEASCGHAQTFTLSSKKCLNLSNER